MTAIPNEQKHTAEEYFRLTESLEERTELIDGQIIAMASPNIRHQILASRLFGRADQYILANHGKCIAMQAVDVQMDDGTVVVPDVLVMCDPDKMDNQRCYGAPDWVVEITSQNRENDFDRKLGLYRENGVREYWIVDTDKEKVWVYVFEHHPNVVGYYNWTDEIPVGIYGGNLTIRIADLV
ncbi:MAG: Uma2 family endonuclease [Oscillospiraceae bacterium]|nr:Uma2 family endonuclease [Oscillospiraceae bacterium]